MLLAADETPVCFMPRTRTYQPKDQRRRVFVPHDKRMITVTPVVARSGEVVTMQLLWAGRTDLCHPRGQAADSRVYNIQICFKK